jgi:DNA-binding transcriptional regulator YdaS (Cro superfamily)
MPKQPDKIVAKIHATRGLSAEIARACGIHRASVYQWKRVPPVQVLTVAELTGLTPEQIRPDVFRPRKHQAAETKKGK